MGPFFLWRRCRLRTNNVVVRNMLKHQNVARLSIPEAVEKDVVKAADKHNWYIMQKKPETGLKTEKFNMRPWFQKMVHNEWI